MPTSLTHLAITDYGSLAEACSRLHDCLFNLEAAEYQAPTGTWVGKFIRPLDDPKQIESTRTWLLATVYRFPVVETLLRLHGVRACRIQDRAEIGTYTLNVCFPTRTGCSLIFNEALTIELDFSGLPVGELRDIRVLPRRGYVTSWLFLETGMRLE